jgi:hypothetical protein
MVLKVMTITEGLTKLTKSSQESELCQDAQPKTDPSEDYETLLHAVESSSQCAGPDLTATK